MASRTKKRHNSTRSSADAQGIVAAAEQDLELTAEQLKDAADSVIGRLGDLKRRKVPRRSVPSKAEASARAQNAVKKSKRR